MNRYCFLLRVKPELLDEYRARHRQVWPEMLHVWHLFHPELKAGRKAIEQGGAFVRGMMAS